MKTKIRAFILWLINEYRLAQDSCSWCGRRGVEAVSIAYPDRLCMGCGTHAQDAAMLKGYTKPVVEEEEVPNFDTYPYSIPEYIKKGHTQRRTNEGPRNIC